MSYKTLGRIIKEVVTNQSQPTGYYNLDTSIKAVMKGSVKKIEKDNPNIEPAGDAADTQKDLDNYNQNIQMNRRSKIQRANKIYE